MCWPRGWRQRKRAQKFQLAANDAKATPVEIAVPYTIGMWQATQPVEISLVNGKNVLHFAPTRRKPRGVTITGVHADAGERIRREINVKAVMNSELLLLDGATGTELNRTRGGYRLAPVVGESRRPRMRRCVIGRSHRLQNRD